MLGSRRTFREISEQVRELDFIMSDNDAAQEGLDDVSLRARRDRRPTLPQRVRLEG